MKSIEEIFRNPTPSELIPEKYTKELPPSTPEVAAIIEKIKETHERYQAARPGKRADDDHHEEHIYDYCHHLDAVKRKLVNSCPVLEVPGRFRSYHMDDKITKGR